MARPSSPPRANCGATASCSSGAAGMRIDAGPAAPRPGAASPALYVGQWNRAFRRRYLKFATPEHVACYAPTRSGKGVGLVIPNALRWRGSLICLDVKRENFKATAGARAAQGDQVFLFDPMAPDGRTARYNPFTYVRRGTVDAFGDIQRIAQMFFPHLEGDGNQGFFQDAARSAFSGAASFLAETPGAQLTLGEVFRLLCRADGPSFII